MQFEKKIYFLGNNLENSDIFIIERAILLIQILSTTICEKHESL